MTEFRISDELAVVRRDDEVTAIALDGRLDPQPVVIRDSGVTIFDALTSWTTIADLCDLVSAQFALTSADVASDVRNFVAGLTSLGIAIERPVTLPDKQVRR